MTTVISISSIANARSSGDSAAVIADAVAVRQRRAVIGQLNRRHHAIISAARMLMLMMMTQQSTTDAYVDKDDQSERRQHYTDNSDQMSTRYTHAHARACVMH